MGKTEPGKGGGKKHSNHRKQLGQKKELAVHQTECMGFPGGSDGKVSAYTAGDPGSIPGLGRSPGERNGNPLPTPVLLSGKSHGWRSLVGYSPSG